VALNKCDLVGQDRLAAVTRDIEASLAGTGLAGSEIVPVSAVTGTGLDALAARLDAALALQTARPREGRFRLAVDRSFTLAGLGTAVTGTVLSGVVRTDDRVLVSPSGLEARVRSIHAQNKPVDQGEAGQRCALVLSGAHVSTDIAICDGKVVFLVILQDSSAEKECARYVILKVDRRCEVLCCIWSVLHQKVETAPVVICRPEIRGERYRLVTILHRLRITLLRGISSAAVQICRGRIRICLDLFCIPCYRIFRLCEYGGTIYPSCDQKE